MDFSFVSGSNETKKTQFVADSQHKPASFSNYLSHFLHFTTISSPVNIRDAKVLFPLAASLLNFAPAQGCKDFRATLRAASLLPGLAMRRSRQGYR